MDLNPREIIFIQHLLEEKQYRPLSFYAQKINVTVRTLRTDLKNIEEYFKTIGIRLERKSGRGILLEEDAKERVELQQNIFTDRQNKNCLTPVGRRREILYDLLTETDSSFSIQKLSEKFYVSPASIVNDLKYIEKWLNHHGLQLLRGTAGTKVEGGETQVRKAIVDFIEGNGFENTMQLQKLDSQKIERMTVESLLTFFGTQDMHFMEGVLNSLEKRCGNIIGEPYYLNLLVHLLVAVMRVKSQKYVARQEENMILQYPQVYTHAIRITEQLQTHFSIRMEDTESLYIYQLLVAFGIGMKGESVTEIFKTGKELTEKLLFWISKAVDMDFRVDEKLRNEMELYICSMMNRQLYDIRIKNNMLSGIRDLYPELMAFVEGVLWCFSKYYKYKMVSQDETAYITMYCQAAVEASRKSPKVLMVCQSGYGTSQLLKMRLNQAFPDIHVANVMSVRTLQEAELSEYSFVISTVRLQALPIPHIVITPLMTEQDVEKIKNSGLLNWSGQYENKQKKMKGLIADEILKIVEEKNSWERLIKKTEEFPEADRYRLFGGNMSVFIVRKGGKKKLFLYVEEDKKLQMLIYGSNTGEILSLLAFGYKLVGSVDEVYRLNDYYREHEFLKKVLPDNRIITKCKAETKEEVIRNLSKLLFEEKIIEDSEAFYIDVLSREMEGNTAIEDDVALPHGQAQNMALAMAILSEPLPWWECEGEKVHVRIVVLFAINSKDAYNRKSDYFKALSIISRGMDSFEKRELLYEAEDGKQILEILSRGMRETEEDI